MGRGTLVVLFIVIFAGGVMADQARLDPGIEDRQDRERGATYGEGDTVEFNTTDLDLEIGLTQTRVARITNDGLRTDTYDIWTSTSGDADVYTRYDNVDQLEGDRARVSVEGRSTRGVSLTFSPRTCYRSECSGELTVHVQDRETGQRFDIDMPLTVSRGVQGVQAPGITLSHLLVLVLGAAAVMVRRRPKD